MKDVRIGKNIIGKNRPVFIIAEAGVNHNGRLDLALKLIDAAAKAGADAVKFQTFKAEEVATREANMASYQKRNLGHKENQLSMLKKLELNEEYYPILIKRCQEQGIMFLSTPHGGIQSVNFLQKLNHPAYKIASPDITNRPLLEHVARTKKPVILSTGMATLKEVQDAFSWLKKAGANNIIILHCTSNYPTPKEAVHLRAMQTLMTSFDVPIGYSDHTEGEAASILAAMLGACVIEKHFTLDCTMKGPDHAASLEPDELHSMVLKIRDIEHYLGSPIKRPTKTERTIMPLVRKSMVAAHALTKGESITLTSIAFKRPGTGISPSRYKEILGKRIKRDVPADHQFKRNDYE